MGAQLWYHEAPWHPDPGAALKALQARIFAEGYDLTKQLPQELAWARETVAATEKEGDPYELLDMYRRKVELLERLCSQPVPEDVEARIDIVRKLLADSGQGIGNVLDVKRVTDRRDFLTAERLSEPEMKRLVGAARPDRRQAQQAVSKINEELGRGECVCFPMYDGGQPAGWYFVGNTID
jgi:hypothetical protein